MGNRAFLAGLNLVGLRRRGFEREVIHDLRRAHKLIFAETGTLKQRIEENPANRDRILALMEGVGFSLWAEELLTTDPSGRLVVLRGLEEFREHLGGELCITLVTAPGEAREVHEMDDNLVLQSLEWLRRRALPAVPALT